MKKYILVLLLLLGAVSCTKIEPDDNTLDAKKKTEVIIIPGHPNIVK